MAGLIDAAILAQAEALVERCRASGVMLATAESCTGGLIAATLTAIAGSSAVVDRGFVTYGNAAKSDMVGVAPALIAEHGAVSAEVARAMAEGALARSRADMAVAVTGLAGPGGGSVDKPVGLVWFACARRGQPSVTASHVFPGDRAEIRRRTVAEALALLDREL